MTKVITFANFKGGTGKTTNSTMLAYTLSNMGYKILLVDQDPQANATSLFAKTYENINGNPPQFYKTLMAAVEDTDLHDVITTIKPNLDLMASYRDFIDYPDFLEDKFPGAANRPQRVRYFAQLLEPIKSAYDFVFIDVPPTVSVYTKGALYASDAAVIVLQTQERSLDGAENFLFELQKLIDDQQHFVDIVGVLPVILKHGGKVDEYALQTAKELFGEENIFKNVIRYMERLKRWDVTGITHNEKDVHDNRVHEVYEELANEFLARVSALEPEEV